MKAYNFNFPYSVLFDKLQNNKKKLSKVQYPIQVFYGFSRVHICGCILVHNGRDISIQRIVNIVELQKTSELADKNVVILLQNLANVVCM